MSSRERSGNSRSQLSSLVMTVPSMPKDGPISNRPTTLTCAVVDLRGDRRRPARTVRADRPELGARRRVEQHHVLLPQQRPALRRSPGVSSRSSSGSMPIDVDAAALVVPRVLPGRRERCRRALTSATPRRPAPGRAGGSRTAAGRTMNTLSRAEQRDVVAEALVEAQRALEQRGAEAELHHDQQHGEARCRRRATARRSGLWRSCASRAARHGPEALMPVSGRSRPRPAGLRQGRGRRRVVEPDLDLDDARVLACGRVGADLVQLLHLGADALDRAGERRAAAQRC